jgi:hypothetical protein
MWLKIGLTTPSFGAKLRYRTLIFNLSLLPWRNIPALIV